MNCKRSTDTENDWTFEDALDAGVITVEDELPNSVDLRQDGWQAENQGKTGACVGFATAYGVLRWHYVEKGLISTDQ